MSKALMSSRERMLAALKREGPDHIPFSPYMGNWSSVGEPLVWYGPVRRLERMLELGLDPCMDVWLPDPQPHPDVEIRTWREKQGNVVLLTKEYHTPAGVLRQVVEEGDNWCSNRHGPWIPTTWSVEKRDHFGMDLFDDWNISRRREPWIKDRTDLDKLRYLIRLPEGHVLDEWRMDAQRAMEAAAHYGVLTTARRTIAGDAFQWFCDIPWFMLQLYDDPEFVREFLGIFQEWGLAMVREVLDVGVDVVQYRGWYEIPTFWGPQGWSEFLRPLINEQAELVHSAGKLATYLLPEGHGAYTRELKECGVDALQGVDPRKLHGDDIGALAAELGKDKAFWGGVNAEVTLYSCDAAAIDAAVADAVRALGANGGLVLSAFLFEETPLNGMLEFVEAWRRHRDG